MTVRGIMNCIFIECTYWFLFIITNIYIYFFDNENSFVPIVQDSSDYTKRTIDIVHTNVPTIISH